MGPAALRCARRGFVQIDLRRQGQLHQDAVDPGIAVEPVDQFQQLRLGGAVREPVLERRHAREAGRADDRQERYDAWFRSVFADWKRANAEIREADRRKWSGRTAPDPRALFDGFWQWNRVEATSSADPLETFRGYWNADWKPPPQVR